MRLFLGLEIPLAVKKQIYDYLMTVRKSEDGWEKPSDYHQTLLFLGEISPKDKEEIQKRMDDLIFSDFHLTTAGFHFFDRRTMYLSFETSAELLELYHRVHSTFSEWAHDGKHPFVPHLTVKRWPDEKYNNLHDGLSSRPFNNIHFEVNQLSLFCSEKDVVGNKYHVIHRKHF